MLCGDIRADMVEYVICFLTSALSYFGVLEFEHHEHSRGSKEGGASIVD